ENKVKRLHIATRILTGLDGIKKMVTAPETDIVLSAISGAAGLWPSIWTVENGKTLALANKESLVMAGDILMAKARKYNARIMPVDSEHSAIFQLIQQTEPQRSPDVPVGTEPQCSPVTYNGATPPNIKRVILTASGGPFYRYRPDALKHVSPKQAFNHPTWQMGAKITIDSATLINKALEIIEAHHLFGLPAEKIGVVIHPQSIVHGMVELANGATLAHLSKPDMKIPIRYALTYPDNSNSSKGLCALGVSAVNNLTFEPPDHRCAPIFRKALSLGYAVIKHGGVSGAVLNAANEEAVKLFLKKQIRFTDIVGLTEQVFKRYIKSRNKVTRPQPVPSHHVGMTWHLCGARPTLKDILEADRWARAMRHRLQRSVRFNP
ncbi:MAG: 1-deoxy-D-xylulose-5-phosphate reductoisomerase, partial [Planctomycetes bacterium]|nr:1-deoxy-D-xylulose-5-phosphate reductoisomerase [Planctomycetota bacterium]